MRRALALTALAAALAGCVGQDSIRKEPLRPIVQRVCDMADSAMLYLPPSKLPFSPSGLDGLRTDKEILDEAFEPTPTE